MFVQSDRLWLHSSSCCFCGCCCCCGNSQIWVSEYECFELLSVLLNLPKILLHMAIYEHIFYTNFKERHNLLANKLFHQQSSSTVLSGLSKNFMVCMQRLSRNTTHHMMCDTIHFFEMFREFICLLAHSDFQSFMKIYYGGCHG